MPRENVDDQHLARLRKYYKSHQALPSLARLADVLGMASTASVFGLISRLEQSGFLRKTEAKRLAPAARFFERPVVGTVRAGVPQATAQSEFEVLTIDDYLVEEPNRTVLVRVRGDSMKDAGFLDGDLVAVLRGAPAEPGDVVVAVVDDETTLKTLAKDDSGYYLQAANAAYGPIRPMDSLELLGPVVGSIRKLKRRG
ncbi:hypothetical protein IP84_04225 [beta proteobacterium AAP99]|nr:hypothetical protein IP84_04225 [beta proteobacterium AAP99]